MDQGVKNWLKIDVAQFFSIVGVILTAMWAIDAKITSHTQTILDRVNTIDNRIIARVLINETDLKDLARRINRLHEHSLLLKKRTTRYAIIDKR